mmetsp:Transcript_105922/g.252716  ORF Transcript_105922/g.252716 Transcript_105922/m.252716 type:complete len:226 (+) Transcript_105922:247-924(+)
MDGFQVGSALHVRREGGIESLDGTPKLGQGEILQIPLCKLLKVDHAVAVLVQLMPEPLHPTIGKVVLRTVQQREDHLLKLWILNDARLVGVEVIELHLDPVKVHARAMVLLRQVQRQAAPSFTAQREEMVAVPGHEAPRLDGALPHTAVFVGGVQNTVRDVLSVEDFEKASPERREVHASILLGPRSTLERVKRKLHLVVVEVKLPRELPSMCAHVNEAWERSVS